MKRIFIVLLCINFFSIFASEADRPRFVMQFVVAGSHELQQLNSIPLGTILEAMQSHGATPDQMQSARAQILEFENKIRAGMILNIQRQMQVNGLFEDAGMPEMRHTRRGDRHRQDKFVQQRKYYRTNNRVDRPTFAQCNPTKSKRNY